MNAPIFELFAFLPCISITLGTVCSIDSTGTYVDVTSTVAATFGFLLETTFIEAVPGFLK